MAAWVGPAIVAALISGSISLLALYLGGWISIWHERRRRKEKMYRDYIEMQKYLVETAKLSTRALDRSLGDHSFFSTPVSDRSAQ